MSIVKQGIDPNILYLKHKTLENDITQRKKMLSYVAKETMGALITGSYLDNSNNVYKLQKKYQISKKINKLHQIDVNFIPRYTFSNIIIKNCDTMLATYSKNAIFVNFANKYKAGGGFHKGCHAQEEDLHRRSSLATQLEYQIKKKVLKYPIPDEGVIFSSKVTFFRGTIEQGYRFQKPFCRSVISAAAPDLRNSRNLQKYKSNQNFNQEYYNTFKARIRTILRAGRLEQPTADTIVLGAFGCGAFRNPPEIVAELFKQVLTEDSIKGLYQNIIFAIKDDKNSNNFDVFNRVFS